VDTAKEQSQSQMFAVDKAYERVAAAYTAARSEVYDAYPEGLPSHSVLTMRQRSRITELLVAEADLALARRERRSCVEMHQLNFP
jgi:hypothetical protein